jgi:enediyne biosynthesis thioesterase
MKTLEDVESVGVSQPRSGMAAFSHSAAAKSRAAYRYRHRVSFEDTNLVGNVYFVRYVSWQGRCRELFLLERAPEVLSELDRSLRLVTTKVACEYFAELRALDEVEISMVLAYQRQNRIGLEFEYMALRESSELLVARGTQEIASMQQTAEGLVSCPIPAALLAALEPYR